MRERWPGILLCALVAFFPLGRAADKSGTLPEGVKVKTYFGWPNCLVLEAADPEVRAIVAPAVGGRIVHYSHKGNNIIFENPASEGKTLANTKDGGWIVFGVREPDHEFVGVTAEISASIDPSDVVGMLHDNAAPKVRCAIYRRKSTEEGLEH